MKCTASLLLVLLACITLLPSFPAIVPTGGEGEQTAIGDLDICHSSVPSLTASGDMPYLSVPIITQEPPSIPVPSNLEQPFLTHFLLTAQDEHPPKA
jgi:hypothetical protein